MVKQWTLTSTGRRACTRCYHFTLFLSFFLSSWRNLIVFCSKLHEGCADKKCPGHRARLFSSLVQCPDVLCCFLNRIEHNYDDGSQSKNSDPFEYPEQFSMAE
jgi:hypothetical protein